MKEKPEFNHDTTVHDWCEAAGIKLIVHHASDPYDRGPKAIRGYEVRDLMSNDTLHEALITTLEGVIKLAKDVLEKKKRSK